MQTTTITRRAALAGAAALPAISLPAAAAETEDPAFAAVRRWMAADMDVRACNDPGIPDGDARAEALLEREGGLWRELLETPPQMAAGLALTLPPSSTMPRGAP